MDIRDAAPGDLSAIAAIYAHHVLHGTGTFEEVPPDEAEIARRIAAPGAPDAALWRALDRAGIGELVRALPDGLNTGCGEGGARFSGGQARRLALARVLLSAAPVLVLDEPTAGLDAAAERAFLETLEGATSGRTVILLAHRLTGTERPTRVLRLAGGLALPAAG